MVNCGNTPLQVHYHNYIDLKFNFRTSLPDRLDIGVEGWVGSDCLAFMAIAPKTQEEKNEKGLNGSYIKI